MFAFQFCFRTANPFGSGFKVRITKHGHSCCHYSLYCFVCRRITVGAFVLKLGAHGKGLETSGENSLATVLVTRKTSRTTDIYELVWLHMKFGLFFLKNDVFLWWLLCVEYGSRVCGWRKERSNEVCKKARRAGEMVQPSKAGLTIKNANKQEKVPLWKLLATQWSKWIQGQQLFTFCLLFLRL